MKTKGKNKTGLRPIFALPLFLFLAAAVTWPLAVTSQPHDHADTLFNTWLLQWNVHAIMSGQNPLHLPMFSGFPDGNGRNDLLLSQSLAALPMQLFGVNPVRNHNILLVLSLALTGLAAAILAGETGASFAGSIFTGSAVVLLPYFQSHLWHLQLFSVGFAILAIVYGIRILKGTTSGWQLGLLVFLQCMASLYQWYFLNLALVILSVFTVFMPERKKLLRLIGWWAGGNLAALPFLLPHLENAAQWSINSIASTDAAAFLAPWGNSVLVGWMRSDVVHPEAALWPGLAVLAGFVWFLFKGEKSRWDGFLLACLIFFVVFSLGPTLVVFGRDLAPAPFRYIAELPGCSSIRLPARAGIFALISLAVFAGRKLGEKPVLCCAGILLAAAAVWHPPVETHTIVTQPWHRWIADHNFHRVLFLPISSSMDRPEIETERLYGSAAHFTQSVNGYSTTLPENYENYANTLNQWPSARAKILIEELQVDCIIIDGWQPFDPDTVFFDGRRTVSAVVTGIY